MLRLLGPVEASGSARTAAGSPRQRLVLAALCADVGRVVLMEVLLDRLWGAHLPERARRTLHAYLARTRRLLEGVLLMGVTNGRPTGQRGALAWARFGSTTDTDLAFRMLVNVT